MGYRYAEERHFKRHKRCEVEGGRLMAKGCLTLVVVWCALWAAVAAVGCGVQMGVVPDGTDKPPARQEQR